MKKTSGKKIRLAVAGAAGRMGKMILSLALRDSDFEITGALESESCNLLGEDLSRVLGVSDPLGVPLTHDCGIALKEADVLIDFTHPSAMPFYLNAALRTKTAYVLGTTGLDEKAIASLKRASARIGVVQSPNMSVGVNLLFRLAEITAKALDESYDVEISEIHHRMKKDSPSGTAMKLLEVIAAARKKNLKKDVVYGREGEVGARPRGEIGVFGLRGGDVVGDHTVYFLGDGERIELSHFASSREAFAGGALRAAKFITKRKNGFFNMRQVLGID